jgi:tetratricopeptide (TPR) repeat protein
MTDAPTPPDPGPRQPAASQQLCDLFGQSQTDFSDGNIANSAQILRQILEVDPDFLPARRLLGRACLHLGQPENAAGEFMRVLGEQPECPVALLGLGHAHFQQRDRQSALAIYRKLVVLHTQACQGYASIADITPDESERLAALSACADCLTRQCAYISSYRQFSASINALINSRQARRALAHLQESEAHHAGHTGFHDLMARAAYFSGEYETGFLHKIQALLALRPENTPSGPSGQGRLPGHALRSLPPITASLRAAGLIPVAIGGTLLGLVRNKGLLAYDRDVDIGIIVPPGQSADPVDIVRAHPDLCLNRHARPGDRYLPILQDGIGIDLFRLDPDGEDFLFGFSDRAGDVQWRIPRFQPEGEDVYGLAILRRDDATACLRALYGPGWRVPDPLFTSAVQSPALHEVHLHVRAYYAAHRARNALLTGHPDKAWHLIKSSPLPIPFGASRFQAIWTPSKGSDI